VFSPSPRDDVRLNKLVPQKIAVPEALGDIQTPLHLSPSIGRYKNSPLKLGDIHGNFTAKANRAGRHRVGMGRKLVARCGD
jgi:hypothetical protein